MTAVLAVAAAWTDSMRTTVRLSPLRGGTGGTLLVLFLVMDVVVIALHVVTKTVDGLDRPTTDLGADRSYGEFLMYVKFVWITLLMIVLAARRRTPAFAALGLAAFVMLLEDALLFHEHVGRALRPHVADLLPALTGRGILTVQVGELLWFAVVGILVVTVFVLSYLRAAPDERRDARSIVFFFGALVLFGVGLDTVHSFFALGSVGDAILTPVEDGGELIALSPAVALAFAFATERRRDEVGGMSRTPDRIP